MPLTQKKRGRTRRSGASFAAERVSVAEIIILHRGGAPLPSIPRVEEAPNPRKAARNEAGSGRTHRLPTAEAEGVPWGWCAALST